MSQDVLGWKGRHKFLRLHQIQVRCPCVIVIILSASDLVSNYEL